MFTIIALIAFTLSGRVIAGPVFSEPSTHHSLNLAKRESPTDVQFFNKGGKPDGDQAQKDSPVDGDVLTVSPGCGEISVTIVKANDAQCNFFLPTDGSMVAGTVYTGAPAAGFFSISVPGACAGGQLNVATECTSCETLGENFNGLDCFGKAGGSKDNANLCVQGTTLVSC